ncbi:MAG: hypothetical protein M3M96_04230 [Candidatus Eremiobacteraeota bacterium]|nr:hypothetical protein [Candidatus Eremiobacteraeota bacterium]
MFGLTLPTLTPKKLVFLSFLVLAGCGGANACCTIPSGVNKVGGVVPPGNGAPIGPSGPAVTVGNGGGGGAPVSVPVTGTGPFTATGCPGIVNATVTGSVVNLVGVGAGTCVVVITGPNGAQGTITVTVSPAPPITASPGTIGLLPGATGGFTVSGPGPFTATGCPGIVNATVTGNVVNLVAVGAGVCAVVVTGPGGVQTIVNTTVSANTPLAANPGTINLGTGGTGAITVTGTGPFTATGCPGIINATVTGNVVNLAGVGAGVCVIVITDANGVKTTVVGTVTAATPLTATPAVINLGPGGTGSISVSGTGPFTATGCPGIINATVTGNVVNLVGVGAGVCAILITGPNGVQTTVVGTVSATTPITANPTTVQLAPGATAGVTIAGTGPFTATGCPGIVTATVTGNVVNLVGVGAGVCVVVVTGPNGVTATIGTTVSATPPIALAPTAVTLGAGGAGTVAITGTGPFTATGCPGIVNATVTGNVLNLAALGAGVCAVVVTGPGGVQSTVLTTVNASTPLVATPATANLTVLSPIVPVTITGTGPFTATACPGVVSASVTGNVVTLTRIGIGVCAVVITGAGGVQTTVLVTST